MVARDVSGGRAVHQARHIVPPQRERAMRIEEQAGDREAAGAIAGMLELYGAPAEPVTEPVPMDLLILDPSELEPE